MTMDTDEYSITMDVLESLETKIHSITKQCESIDHNLKNLKKLIESFWRDRDDREQRIYRNQTTRGRIVLN